MAHVLFEAFLVGKGVREIAGQEGNFADPVGGSLERYSATADELEKIIEDSYERITAVVGKRG